MSGKHYVPQAKRDLVVYLAIQHQHLRARFTYQTASRSVYRHTLPKARRGLPYDEAMPDLAFSSQGFSSARAGAGRLGKCGAASRQTRKVRAGHFLVEREVEERVAKNNNRDAERGLMTAFFP